MEGERNHFLEKKKNSSRAEGRIRQEDLKKHCGEVMRERDKAKNTV